MRASKVIYDRAGSSIAEASVDDFDFDKIMDGADWFHWSGITPAISANGAALIQSGLHRGEEARRYRFLRFKLS